MANIVLKKYARNTDSTYIKLASLEESCKKNTKITIDAVPVNLVVIHL